MKDLWKFLFGALCAFLGVGLILLVSGRPRGQPIGLTPPPSPAPLIVHVTGAVLHPGVYSLPSQGRVWDAVQAAGGLSPQADQGALNLAAFLEDGSQIEVPLFVETLPTQETASTLEIAAEGAVAPSPTPGPPTPTPYPRINFPIDLNTASSAELELLPQIGQVRAARIVSYRQAHGPFKRIEDVRNVYDISPEVYAAIRDLITVGELPATATPAPF